ncbi:MAG: hypothetical protein ACYCPP_08925 [Nitrososphaerales archaeon]
MLPLPASTVEVDFVVEVVFDEVEVVVVTVVEAESVEVDAEVEVVVVVGVDADVEVDVGLVVESSVVLDRDDEVEVIVLDETRGDTRRVNRTSEDTRITTATAPIVTLRVLFIVFIRA